MTVQNHKRKKQKAKTRFLVILALLIGFVAGVVLTVVLSQNYTIVISDSEKKASPVVAEEKTMKKEVPKEEKTRKNLPEKTSEKGKVIVIDAGHQKAGNSSQEPIAPGASQTKAKVAGGTAGVSTKTPEYQVNLEVSLLLEEELKNRGYDVVMIRRTNEVDISNSQRAKVANEAGADAFIRIHCNGAQSSGAKGALTMCQTPNNPYCGDLYQQSRALSERVIDGLCQQTGAKKLGVTETDTMSGINWCRVPVTIVEMGFMTNPEEDTLLCNPSYQKKLASGIANGIDAYFRK